MEAQGREEEVVADLSPLNVDVSIGRDYVAYCCRRWIQYFQSGKVHA